MTRRFRSVQANDVFFTFSFCQGFPEFEEAVEREELLKFLKL